MRNEELLRTSVQISSGGSTGPYRLTVERLSREKLDKLIPLVLQALNQVQ